MSSPSANPRDQQFCLRWNNYQSNLTQVFNQLFQSESFVDVTLACEGHSVRAHRLVLSACSPYFLTVLTETPCSHPVIILQGVKWSELKAVVEFMYKGEINICQEQLASLLRVAESLKIRGLADVGGEEAEAVLTSPSESPRGGSQFWAEDTPRKRRRLSEEPRSRSRSRSPTPGPRTPLTPSSGGEVLDTIVDLPGTLNRGPSSASNPPPSLPSPSPVASLASSLSSLAHLHGPMPPPGPPLPPHLAHLPPLSPLSPLLNMHPMPRHHSPEDFEIRPGIAEMIREEERAKLLESTHHWIGNPMADSYQAQVQAAWQKSWNQTQSLLQNLRFRERGPLKSWRPETMAEAIHAVLKEGLSLSQAARKYDIPYPTFVLYANRVHNLLGPSHEPGDMRPKGRGRPQRILLGAWPEDQIKGVIRAVVFRDTTVFRDGDHKENKKPTTPQIKDETAPVTQSSSNGPFTPNSASLTPNGTPDKSGDSTPIPPSTPSTSQPLLPGSIGIPLTTPPTPGAAIPLPSPLSKEANRISPSGESRAGSIVPSTNSSSSPSTVSVATTSGTQSLTTSTSSIPPGPHTPQSRPSSVTSNGPLNGPHQNGLSNALSHSSVNSLTSNTATNMNGMVIPGLPSPASTNGAPPLAPNPNQVQSPLNQQAKPPQISPPVQQQLKAQQQSSQHSHLNHQQPPLHNNSQLQQRNPHYPHHNHQHPSRHQQNPLGPIAAPQQMLGLITGGLSPSSLGTPPAHMARLFGEGPPPMHTRPPQPPINAFHPGFPRPAHPGMQPMPMHNPMNSMGARINMDEHDPSPEAILFGKLAPTDRHPFGQTGLDMGGRQIASNPFDNVADTPTNALERPMMFREAIDTIKSEPEAIMN